MNKKRAVFIALLALITTALLVPLTSSAASWSPAFPLGKGDIKPAVAIDSKGRQHYVWYNSSNKRIQYSSCSGLAGNGCSSPVDISTNGDSYWPNIGIDPENRPNVVYETKIGGGLVYAVFWTRLEKGGWTEPKQISDETYGELPDIAIGPTGIIHVTYQSKQGDIVVVYYTESAGGFDFSPAVQIDQIQSNLPLTTFAEMDSAQVDPTTGNAQIGNGMFPRIGVDDQDRAHLVWSLLGPSYGVRYIFQTNNGWSRAIKVGDGEADQTPDITIAPNGVAGIIWGRYTTFNSSFAEYNDGVRNNLINDVDEGLVYSLWPRVSTDCQGNFHFTYQGRVSTNSSWNIYYRRYKPASNALGPQETISTLGNDEQTPAIATTNVGAIVYNNTNLQITDGITKDFGIECDTGATSTPTNTPTATLTPTTAATVDLSVTPTATPTATNTPTPTKTPAKKIYYDDRNAAFNYVGKWNKVKFNPSCAYNKTFSYAEPKAGNHVSLTFNGTRFKYWFISASDMGKVKILIDGQKVAVVRLHKSDVPRCKSWDSPDLASGQHTFELRRKGISGNISLDVLTVFP